MRSEINPLDLAVVSEFFRSTGPKNRSIVDDISAVSDLQGFSHIMVCNQHTDLLGFQVVNDLLNLEYGNRIDSGKRLVQQNEFGRYHQRSRYFHAASFPTG